MNIRLVLLLAGAALAVTAQNNVNPSTYNMENGELGPRGQLWRDDLYKGNGDRQKDNAQLTEGLGQLADSITACSDDPSADCGNGPGYDWVGWHHIDPAITFVFAERCVFNTVRIFAANKPEEGVRLFKTAVVSLSDDGFTFRDYAVWTATPADNRDETARYIDIPVHGSATSVRIRMLRANDAAWVLISEVKFQGRISPDQAPRTKPK